MNFDAAKVVGVSAVTLSLAVLPLALPVSAQNNAGSGTSGDSISGTTTGVGSSTAGTNTGGVGGSNSSNNTGFGSPISTGTGFGS